MKFFTNIILFTVLSVSLFYTDARSQHRQELTLGNGFSIIPSVNYVSSATIQLSPFSKDIIERSSSISLSGGYGYGISIKKKLFRNDLSFALSAEYTKINDDNVFQTLFSDSSRARVKFTEELVMIPIELSGYFNIPDFSEDLKIFLGAGVGAYFGDRKRTLGNIQSKTISKQAGFSFVVLSGLEYYFSRKVSGVFEIRFREGEYTVKSEFPVSSVNIGGTFFPLERNLNSKIYVDGLKLSFGLSYNF
ncbi:MAG: hypothetical protein SGI89_06195 [bacterium]|nr:hypothetical protein [bacterium]